MSMSLRTAIGQCVTVEPSVQLAKRIKHMERAFVTRNEDHIAFFGGALLGVHPVRFKTTDRNEWLNEIAQTDELEIEDSLDVLIKHINNPNIISKNWVRANDSVNLTMLYMTHLFITNTTLPVSVREEAAVDCLKLLYYKFITSLLSRYFPHSADENLAQTVYGEMSKKFDLKVAGSWYNLFDTRARTLITPKSIHYKTLRTFENTAAVIYMISDIQTRLKEQMKSMTDLFYRVKDAGNKISKSSTIAEWDGEDVVKDKTRQYSTYLHYIHEVIDDRQSFIKEDLIRVILDAMHTVSPRMFRDCLEFISRSYRLPKQDYLQEFVNEVLIHAFDVMASDRRLYAKSSGITPMISRLRALYMASRMSDPALLQMKEHADRLVVQAVKTSNQSMISALRTSIQLYLVLRTLSRSYYQS